jgi:hypothetical protein
MGAHCKSLKRKALVHTAKCRLRWSSSSGTTRFSDAPLSVQSMAVFVPAMRRIALRKFRQPLHRREGTGEALVAMSFTGVRFPVKQIAPRAQHE